MTLKLVGHGPEEFSSRIEEIHHLCQQKNIDLTLEWNNNQYWLHSLAEHENPIGIQIDRELSRHEEFFKRSSIHKDLLARSIGVKSGVRPEVLDLTGGLLGDTLLFLTFGCQVTTLERHPVIQLLIESALKNAHHPALSRLQFIGMDAGTFLKENSSPEVIFFDPMFEDPNERALPKKEMRIFRELIGSDQDAQAVFQVAQAQKAKRLVIKRPRLSINLLGKPDICFEGKATRYDVYLSPK